MNFEKMKGTIEKCAKEANVKPLSECENTIVALKNEAVGNNPYIKLANRIVKYNNGCEETSEEQNAIDDQNFYKYLSSLPDKSKYEFPLADNKTITVEIDLLNPYIYVESEGREFIDPRWHFLVSYLAYKDARYNHGVNIIDEKMTEGLKLPSRGSLKEWFDEAFE